MPSNPICSSKLQTISGNASARSDDDRRLMLIELSLGGRKYAGEIVVEQLRPYGFVPVPFHSLVPHRSLLAGA
jgi:hypothetical protein